MLFIFERVQMGEGQSEGDRGSEAGSALTAVSPYVGLDAGLELMNPQGHDLSRSQTLKRLSHPGAPWSSLSFKGHIYLSDSEESEVPSFRGSHIYTTFAYSFWRFRDPPEAPVCHTGSVRTKSRLQWCSQSPAPCPSLVDAQ